MSFKYINKWNNKIYDDIIDVRTPDEFNEDHIPESINLPVLSNKQRSQVGIIYKNENAFKAKKIGAALISQNISKYLINKLYNKPGNWKPLIYCWRGGQRSKSLATILSEIGWEVHVLKGGYKNYRSTINKEITKLTKKLKFIIIKGPTGCAKTKILVRLKKEGLSILNLEEIACHKGSLLGNIPNKSQPSQKLFESNLYLSLRELQNSNLVFVESESSKIGNIYLPQIVLKKIKNSSIIEINAPIHERINFLIKDYKKYLKQKNSFLDLFNHAETKLGSKVVKVWRSSYFKKDWYKLANSLMIEYYDPLYSHNFKSKKYKIIKKYNLNKLSDNNIIKFCKNLKEEFSPSN